MTEPCSDLVPFADGELEPARAETFRRHLRDCESCQAELVEALQLSARLSMLGLAEAPPEVEGNATEAGVRPSRAATEDEPAGAMSPDGVLIVTAPGAVEIDKAATDDVTAMRIARKQASTSTDPLAPVRSIGSRRTGWIGGAAGALAAAAAVVLVVRSGPLPSPSSPQETVAAIEPTSVNAPPESVDHPPAPPPVVAKDAQQALASAAMRPYDMRLVYGEATAYQPLKVVNRSASNGAPVTPPYTLLAALDNRADTYGLAIVEAWFSGQPDKAIAKLRTLPPSLEVRSNLAAFEGLLTSNDNLEPVLAELEPLAAGGNDAPARAARWNQAVLLERLELPLSAAAAFRKIAAEGERGWSDEARTRADNAARIARTARERWQTAFDQGNAMWRTGALPSESTLREVPGTLRAYFYYAVRLAPNAARVRALLPVAAELDKLDGRPTLTRYAERVAKLDFRRRAPLAALYARWLNGEALTDAERRRITPAAPGAEVADIVLGAMIDLDTAPQQLGVVRALTLAADDRWFEILLALAEATAEQQRGDWLGAEVRLARIAERCTNGVVYQCIEVARRRGYIYQHLHRIPNALEVVKVGIDAARRANEWKRYGALLEQLADIERFNHSTATARVYAREVLQLDGATACDQRSPGDKATAGAAHLIITDTAVLDVDGRAARTALEEATACTGPDLVAANSLADIGRLDPRPGDLAQLRTWLAQIRPGQLPAGQIFADTIEGRLQIESQAAERAAGSALLERAIVAADALPGDMMAGKARAAAYSALIFDDVRRRDHARALALFARELGIALPARCAVGVSAEDERAVIVVRGADGQDHATGDYRRRRDAETPRVTEALARPLEGCDHVQVMARASLQGQPRMLPPRFAWSYATGTHHRALARPDMLVSAPASGAGPGTASGPPQPLIIANVVPPLELHLAPLRAVPDVAAGRMLSGRSATPTRVLAEMRDATEIQFHTHAQVDAGVSDAAHLVLSPELDGRYALTAEAIQTIPLRGQPTVVLAACHSAQGARYQHAPWSLPDAFLAAGARAVFAAATEISDADANAFFDRVLAQVRDGRAPAAALRDERLRILAVDPNSWVGAILLFE